MKLEQADLQARPASRPERELREIWSSGRLGAEADLELRQTWSSGRLGAQADLDVGGASDRSLATSCSSRRPHMVHANSTRLRRDCLSAWHSRTCMSALQEGHHGIVMRK